MYRVKVDDWQTLANVRGNNRNLYESLIHKRYADARVDRDQILTDFNRTHASSAPAFLKSKWQSAAQQDGDVQMWSAFHQIKKNGQTTKGPKSSKKLAKQSESGRQGCEFVSLITEGEGMKTNSAEDIQNNIKSLLKCVVNVCKIPFPEVYKQVYGKQVF